MVACALCLGVASALLKPLLPAELGVAATLDLSPVGVPTALPTLSSVRVALRGVAAGVLKALLRYVFNFLYNAGFTGGEGFPSSRLSFFPSLSQAMWQQVYVRPISSSGFIDEARERDCATRELESSMSSLGIGDVVGRSEMSASSTGDGMVFEVQQFRLGHEAELRELEAQVH